MNKVFRIVALLASFGAGFAAGYFVRKKSELKFEEVTEEELAAIAEEDAQNASQSLSEPQKSINGIIMDWKQIKSFEKKDREWEEEYLFEAFEEAEELISVARKRKLEKKN